jgi:glycosyltransferase 2 family protein
VKARSADAGDEVRLLTPSSTRKLVAIALFTVVVYAVWLFLADFSGIVRSLGSVGPGALLVALAHATANYVIRWLRWHLYLHRLQLSVPVGESFTVFVAGFAMTVTPAKMGEILKSILLKNSRDIPVATTAPIVVAERVTDLGGLVLLAAIGCLVFEAGIAMAVVGALAVLLLSVVCAVRPVGMACVRLCGRLPLLRRKVDRLQVAYDSLHRLSGPITTLQATALSTLAWFTHCTCLWYCAGVIAPGCIDLLESCVAYSAPLLGGTLLLIPGGLGATEASMTGMLVALSEQRVGATEAAAVALLVRLVTFWWAILLGVAALLHWNRRHRRRDGGTPVGQ